VTSVFHIALSSGRVVRRRWRLVVASGPDAPASSILERNPALIGAAPAADLRLSDDTVSRFHCEIDLAPLRARVRDLRSTNGVRVRGQRVEVAEVESGETIHVGGSGVDLVAEDTPGAGAVATALGLERIGPGLEAAFAAAPGPVDLDALRAGHAGASSAHRAALLGDLLDACERDVGRAAHRLGIAPRALFAELARYDVDLGE
jgi:hypothetical protein